MFRGLRFAGLLLSALRFPRGIFCAQAKCFALPLFCSSALAQSQLQVKLLLFFCILCSSSSVPLHFRDLFAVLRTPPNGAQEWAHH